MEPLKELLEGEDEDAWTNFAITYNCFEESAKIEFIETLNIIKCFPPPAEGE